MSPPKSNVRLSLFNKVMRLRWVIYFVILNYCNPENNGVNQTL